MEQKAEQTILDIVQYFEKKLPKFPDGRIDYSSSETAPVITVFVSYGNKILLLKRSDRVSTYRGKWNTVAGYLDEMKPVKEKVLEELGEEVGIEERDISSIKIGDPYEFRDEKIGKTWIVAPVLVKLKKTPEIKLDWEHTDFVWIEPEDICRYDTVPNLDKSLMKVLD
jgi:isopentenyldiphosphate isomerase